MDTQENEEIAARITELAEKVAELKRLARQIEKSLTATSAAA
ncbi:hypothetical protein ABT168_20105 [Streptomyces sp. NPDC001793]